MANEPKKKTSSTAKKTTTTKKKTTTGTIAKKQTTTKKVAPKKEEKKEVVKEETVIKEEKKVTEPKLDYKMILIIILALLIVVIGIAKIGGVFENKDYTKSYLLNNKVITNELNKEDISSTLQNKETFIFITSLNQDEEYNEEEYNLEKDLKKVIKDNDLKDNFYIYLKDDNTNLRELFGIEENTKTPTILYFKNGSLIDKVERLDEKMMEAGDFTKLLDMYELSKEE